GHGALAVHRYVPARVGGFADFLQLSQVDRVVIRGAIGQPGDLVAAHVDATAVDHRATIVDGDAVQVGQVTRHHQDQLVAVAVHAQVGAGGRRAGGQPAGKGRGGVVAQGLAGGAAGVAGKSQAIVLRRKLRAVVGDIPVVVHDEVVAQPRFTLDRQVVGDDAVAVDVGVADGDAVADLDVVSQFERQVRAGTGDLVCRLPPAEINRTTERNVAARAASGADV